MDGIGEGARFNRPLGLAIETEPLAQQLDRELRQEAPPLVQIVVADFGNGVIRRVRADGHVETLGAGTGTAQLRLGSEGPGGLFSPIAVAVDANGNVFFSDGNDILSVLPDGSVVRAAEEATFEGPTAFSISRGGAVAVADSSGVREVRFGEPLIFQTEPSAISNQGGERVTILGRNFASDSIVVIGRQILETEVTDTGTLRFTTPALPSGISTLTVQNRGGVAQTRLVILPTSLEELEPGHITTFAGGSTFVGDGERAIEIGLSNPRGLALDPGGNLYIADVENNRVRRVGTTTGVITTVAGTGESFAEGSPQRPNGILATTAKIQPEELAIDGAGNLFIRTAFDILRVNSATAIINEYSEGFGFIEVAADSSGNLYISRQFQQVVTRIDRETREETVVAGTGEAGFSGDGGPATSAQLNFAEGIAVDAGDNLFLVDSGRIRRIDAATGIITTVAGGGGAADPPGDGGPAIGARLDRPQLVAVDGAGNLYIKQASFQTTPSIRKVDAETGLISTLLTREVIGDLIADASGNVYFSDEVDHQAFRVEGPGEAPILLAGNDLRTPTGDGAIAAGATFDRPDDLTFDRDGNLFIADSFADRIRRIDVETGIITTVAGNGSIGNVRPPEGVLAVEAALFSPGSPAVDLGGNLYFVDLNDFWQVDAVTGLMAAVPVSENQIRATVIDSQGNLVFVGGDKILRLDSANQSLTVVAGTGERGFSGDGGPATQAMISTRRMAFDLVGNLFLAEGERPPVVRRVDSTTGIIETVAGGGDCFAFCESRLATELSLFQAQDIALDFDGNLFLHNGTDTVYRIDAESGIATVVAQFFPFVSSLDNVPATAAMFRVDAIEIDATGNLFIADSENRRIRAVRLR